MSNSSIWLISRTLSGATIMCQSGPWSNGNEVVLYISPISKARASPLDVLMSYLGHSAETMKWRKIYNKIIVIMKCIFIYPVCDNNNNNNNNKQRKKQKLKDWIKRKMSESKNNPYMDDMQKRIRNANIDIWKLINGWNLLDWRWR